MAEPTSTPESLGDENEDEPASAQVKAGGEMGLVLQTLGAMIVLAGAVALAARWLRAPLQLYGTRFVTHFGPWGLVLGTVLADGLHCPVPPQAYMLAAIAAGYSPARTLTFVSLGSMLGACVSIGIGRWATRIGRVRTFLQRSQGRVDQLFSKHGHWAVLVGSFTPTPFSLLCNLAGLYRLPRAMLGLLLLLRIPRLCLYYALIYAGWS